MRLLRSLFAGSLVTLAGLAALPASATSLGAVLATNAGTNTLALQVQIQCSGAICSFIGLGGAGYNQTRTSTLSGTTGLWSDDVADTIQFSSDAAGTADLLSVTGTNVTFTGLSSLLTGNGGSTITVSNLAAYAVDAAVASVLAYDLLAAPQAIGFSTTATIGADGTTNSPNLPTISLTPAPVPVTGTFVSLGDNDADLKPEFEIQNLRGAFQSLTSTVTFGSTLHITLRATFTLNFVGESLTQVPEPASFGLVALGLGSFALAARGRRTH